MTLDLLQPNKSDALNYLDSGAAAPPRYAHATLLYGATTAPYIQEYMVGPLPISGNSTVSELNYIYTKGKGQQLYFLADAASIQALQLQVGTQIQNITKALLNGVRFSTVPHNAWR